MKYDQKCINYKNAIRNEKKKMVRLDKNTSWENLKKNEREKQKLKINFWHNKAWFTRKWPDLK